MAGIRLAKAASEFNQGSQNIVDFLNEKGFSLENKPTTKINGVSLTSAKNVLAIPGITNFKACGRITSK